MGTRGYKVMVDCFNHGLLVRLTGDTIALSRPLIVTPEQIDEMTAILSAAIKRAA